MQIGMIGLGRMGAGMTVRLIAKGHDVVAFDIDPDARATGAAAGATPTESLEALVEALSAPRTVWLMVPAGEITESTVQKLADLLSPGDAVVDGGNSRYTDSLRRFELMNKKEIGYVDCGTSGGIWGQANGFCLMIGGDEATYARLEPVFEALAPEGGYARVGPPGAGHFTKMVHNGVEYALMQAYGEGFELLHDSEMDLDLSTIAELWRHGSVIQSWLLDLTARALAGDPDLAEVSPYIEDSGEGRWTIETALERAIPVPTIATALFARFASRQKASFAGKVIAALRREFGGHAVRLPSRHASNIKEAE